MKFRHVDANGKEFDINKPLSPEASLYVWNVIQAAMEGDQKAKRERNDLNGI